VEPPGDAYRDELDNGDDCKLWSRGCHEIIQMFLCGLGCSPNQGKFCDFLTPLHLVVTEVRICKDLADRMYAACKSDEFKNEKGDECVKASDEWDDGSDFIKGRSPFFKNNTWAVQDTQDDNCLNAAGVMFPSLLLLSLALSFFAFVF
jgi:Folate receptor family